MPAELDLARRRDNPQDPDIDIWQLNYELPCGNAETAEGLAVRVIQRDPLFVPARMNLAQILRMRGDVAGAIRELEVILEQDPKNVYAIETKARAHAQSVQTRSAPSTAPTRGKKATAAARSPSSPARRAATEKPQPKRPTPAPVPAKPAPERTTAQKPTTGDEVRAGSAIAETGAKGIGFGLATGGGGTGGEISLSDFCCPELTTMLDLIQRNWSSKQPATGVATVRFTVLRDGAIVDVSIAQSSGYVVLDLAAQRALLMTRLPPLPPEYTNPRATFRLNFRYEH